MAEKTFRLFELTIMIMESVRQAGVDDPLQIRPDIVDIFYDLPERETDDIFKEELNHRYTELPTHIFIDLYDKGMGRGLVWRTGRGWMLTSKGQFVAQTFLGGSLGTAGALKEAALFFAFSVEPTKETWSALGDFYGWTT